jgi:hypothetical protein
MDLAPHQQGDEVSVAINREIYEALREYCDTNNLRFKYFIEEILEYAPKQDDLLKLSLEASGLLKKVKYLMNKMEDERQRSFERGFTQGVLAALLNYAGYSGISQDTVPEEIRKTLQRKPPRNDRQMSLFD